jgi:hypothetical protein
MKRLAFTCMLCAILSACGGGSGGGTTAPVEPAPSVPTATLSVASQAIRTIAGGAPIALKAALSSGGTVQWKLAEGTPGTLSAATGTSVNYLPPSAGISAVTPVAVTASGDGAGASLTLAVTPDPGPAGIEFIAGHPEPGRLDGIGAAASFPFARKLATDGAGNIYVLEHYSRSPSLPTPPVLRKVTPAGVVTTLPSANFASHLSHPTGFAADRAGNLYVSSALGFGQAGQLGPAAAIFKVTQAGDVSLLAGSDDQQVGALTDGTGTAARFLRPAIEGIDNDGNLYVRDANDTLRTVTPAGVVTTVKSFPPGLHADQNGNTYSYDMASRSLLRTSPTGVTTAVAGGPTCTDLVTGALPGCLPGVVDLVPLGGASYALFGGGFIVRVVVPH